MLRVRMGDLYPGTPRRRSFNVPPPGQPSPLIRSHGQFRFLITLRSHRARPLTNHVQQILAKTPLPEDVTVVFDMDALSFS